MTRRPATRSSNANRLSHLPSRPTHCQLRTKPVSSAVQSRGGGCATICPEAGLPLCDCTLRGGGHPYKTIKEIIDEIGYFILSIFGGARDTLLEREPVVAPAPSPETVSTLAVKWFWKRTRPKPCQLTKPFHGKSCQLSPETVSTLADKRVNSHPNPCQLPRTESTLASRHVSTCAVQSRGGRTRACRV